MELHFNSTYQPKDVCLFIHIYLRGNILTICENFPQQYSKCPNIGVNCVDQICQGLGRHPPHWTVNLGRG